MIPKKDPTVKESWITSRIRPDQKEYLEKKSLERGVTQSEIIRNAIDKDKALPEKSGVSGD